MTEIEKMARAMCAARGWNPDEIMGPFSRYQGLRKLYLKLARAAWEAMRHE